MRRLLLLALICFSGVLASKARAGEAALIADLTTLGLSSNPDKFFALPSSRILFTASTQAEGTELWVSDGTRAGTSLLRALGPGTTRGTFNSFTPFGDRAAFLGGPEGGATALWLTDGTPSGTVTVGGASVVVGALGNDMVYVGNGASGSGLYATDGTPGGTRLLRAVLSAASRPGFVSSEFAGGVMLFAGAASVNDIELWRTDGTALGTRLVRDIYPGTSFSSDPREFVLYESRVYFVGASAGSGRELWRTDGTEIGTELVADLQPGTGSSDPTSLLVSNGRLFFTYTSTTLGSVLASYSAADGVVTLQLPSQQGPTSPQTLWPTASGVVFYGGVPSSASSIWQSDGTLGGTVRLPAIPAGPILAKTFDRYLVKRSGELVSFDLAAPAGWVPMCPGSTSQTLVGMSDGRAVVSSFHGGDVYRLWVTDGTAAGSVQFAPASGGAPYLPSLSRAVVAPSGQVFFAGRGPEGDEPWVSDATVPGTRLLRNIDLRTDHSVDLTSGWRVGDRLLVPHRNDSAADTLVSSLGTPQSTGIAVDLAAFAPFTELGTSAVVAGERLCFMAGYFAGGYFDALLSTDGTPGGTRMEYQIPGPHVSSSSQLIVVGGEVWIAYNASNSIWLYRHNPVTGQTMQFATVGGFISKWERLGNGALLESSSGGVRSFRYTDGTGAGTVQVYSPSVDRASTAMMVGDSAAYFVHDPFVGSPVFATVYEMRRTMGTAGSTSLVCSSSSAIRFLGRLAGNDLLFFGSVDGMPLGLYRTTGDGTAVERLSGVTPDLSAFSGATLNGVSYFSGRTTANGAELWRSDGTAGGTYIVADLVPGTSSSSPRGFYADGNAVYFTTIQSGGTAKVWTTDGTAAGTRLVFTTPTAGALEPKFLGTSEHGVFFAAMSGVLGYELHVLRPGLADCNNNLVHDEVDVLAGLSLDGNLDGRPDECCRGDFNADGLVLVQDIFDFLNAWFAGETRADVNGGGLGVQDIFDFLNGWFLPCP